MPRPPRYFPADTPLHVVHRGNNRSTIFRDASDFAFYKRSLGRAGAEHGLAIHAYVLMTNHVHLLATPASPASAPKVMQSVGVRYARYFNARYERTGTLWEGRYRASIVDSDAYLLACMRYIELNPVRAAMVRDPLAYPWSSHRANRAGLPDELVTTHGVFDALATCASHRRTCYAEICDAAVPAEELETIRNATFRALPLGPSLVADLVSDTEFATSRRRTRRRHRSPVQ